MSGASWSMTFRRIILPLLKPGLIAGWIYIVIVSIRELSSSILLYSPGTEVVSIMIWELWQNGQYVELSALGVMLIVALLSGHAGAVRPARNSASRRPDHADRRRAQHRIPNAARRSREGRAGRQLRGAGGQAVHAARSQRLRQDHDAALDRRAGAADGGEIEVGDHVVYLVGAGTSSSRRTSATSAWCSSPTRSGRT